MVPEDMDGEIRIQKTGEPHTNGDPGADDVTTAYKVVERGREFTLTFRSHKFGSSIGIAGEPGVLYTDTDEGKVHRQVLVLGRDCGINVESDEIVEGLSQRAVRGVTLAHRYGKGEEVVIRTGESEGPDRTEVFVGGRLTDLARYL